MSDRMSTGFSMCPVYRRDGPVVTAHEIVSMACSCGSFDVLMLPNKTFFDVLHCAYVCQIVCAGVRCSVL